MSIKLMIFILFFILFTYNTFIKFLILESSFTFLLYQCIKHKVWLNIGFSSKQPIFRMFVNLKHHLSKKEFCQKYNIKIYSTLDFLKRNKSFLLCKI